MTSQPLLATRGDDELPSQQIAKRIRGLLAENQIKGARLAPLMRLEVKAFNRRLRGEVEWSIDDLSSMATALGMPFDELVRHEGLEPPTRWFAAPALSVVPGPTQEPTPAVAQMASFSGSTTAGLGGAVVDMAAWRAAHLTETVAVVKALGFTVKSAAAVSQ